MQIQFHAKLFEIKSDQVLQLLFIFDPSSCLGLQAMVNVNLNFHTAPQEKVTGSTIWRWWRPRSELPSADPLLRQLPIHECCHLTVDVWWRSVMLKT
jgi:hypothetical protein